MSEITAGGSDIQQGFKFAPNGLCDGDTAGPYIGLTPQTLATWATKAYIEANGVKLPFIKVGRLRRYRKSDLDAYLEARTVRSA